MEGIDVSDAPVNPFDDIVATNFSPPSPTPVSESLGSPNDPKTTDAAAFASGDTEKPSRFSRTSTPRANVAVSKSASAPSEAKPKKSRTALPSRGAKSKKDDAQPADAQRTVRLVPAATNFDFLEGSYEKVLRTRLALITGAGIVLALVIVCFGIGLNAQRTNDDLNAKTAANRVNTEVQNRKYSSETAYIVGNQSQCAHSSTIIVNGEFCITGQDLQAHVSNRAFVMNTALGQQLDVARIISDVGGLASVGLSVTSFSITTPAATSATTPATTTAHDTGATLSITGTAASYNEVQTIFADIQDTTRFPYLFNVTPSWSGGSLNTAITITAQINSNAQLPAPAAAQPALSAH